MNITEIALLLLSCLFIPTVIGRSAEVPEAKITIKVIDEKGVPVEGASVSVGFVDAENRNTPRTVEGVTDAQGLFTSQGRAYFRLGARITKDGYYQSGGGLAELGDIVDGRLQPWNTTATSILRPIGNPVPFFAKRVQTEIPTLDQPCGYDLEKGDWVAPNGKGLKADFVFTGHREFNTATNFDVRVEMEFSSPQDGVLKTEFPAVGKNSVFKWVREAPESGYEKAAQLRHAVNGDTVINAFERSDVFFFRVRTVEKNGQIIAANYGRIYGGLRLDGINAKKTCLILFTYYLNPTSLDRNLEWDPKRNLLSGLSWEETPREP